MSSSTEASTQPVTSENNHAAFIAEHGRYYRPVDHKAFDPFRRRVIPIPTHVLWLTRLACLFLVPFRIAVAVFATLISYILVKVFGPTVTRHAVSNFDVTLLPPWRRRIVVIATRFLGRMLLLALGFWRVSGTDDPSFDPEQASTATIVSNHSSLADPCLLAYLFAPAFVAKTAVYMIPGVGAVGAGQHAFYIDRMHNSLVSIAEKIAERQRLVEKTNGLIPSVAIFPEGTTTNGEHLLKFRTGAFIAGTPIAPTLIQYHYDYFPPSLESIKTGKYVWGLLCQLSTRVHYYRMPVYFPSEEEKTDPQLYARNVYNLMLKKSSHIFDRPLTPSTSNFADKIEYNSLVRGSPLKKGLQLNPLEEVAHTPI